MPSNSLPGLLGVNPLLREICRKLQLNPTRHEKAEARYNGVADWLSEQTSPFRVFQGRIFPQGSFRIGTTVRPYSGNEYDLDLVCLFEATQEQVGKPEDFLKGIRLWLEESPHYRNLTEIKRRCIRLNYADDFHLDILPAIPDPRFPGTTCLLVPDRELKAWKPSNPEGFSSWFFQRAIQTAEFKERLETEPLPSAQALEEKRTLQVVVQLIKRRRDLVFLPEREKHLPVSIVLTTLAGHLYSGQHNPLEAIDAILKKLDFQIQTSPTPLIVQNPSNPAELLSERWVDREVYDSFRRWITSFRGEIETLKELHGPAMSKKIMDLFGEQVTKDALESLGKRFTEKFNQGHFGVTENGRITTASSPTTMSPVLASSPQVTPVNTFFGE